MRCAFCENDLFKTTKTEERRTKEGKLVIFNDVPVLYCNQCQEYFYDDKVLDWIDNVIEKGQPAPLTIPGYIYREEATA